jgi:glycosyltransferase involved in cell wall biosynthesis
LSLAKKKRGSSLQKTRRRISKPQNQNVIVIKHENSGTIRLKDIVKFEGKSQMVQLPAPENRMLHKHLRILMVIDQFNVGGTETHTLGLARELMRNGAHVVVAAKNGRMLDSFVALGCPVYTIDFVNEVFKENLEMKSEIVEYLKLIIRNENISILHAHQYPSGIFSVTAAKDMNIPVVITIHGYVDMSLIQLAKQCDTVLAVSQSIAKLLKANHISSLLLQNGIDVSEFTSHKSIRSYVRASWGIANNAPVVTYAARLSFEKADISLVVMEACRRLIASDYPELKLIIVGSGHHEEMVRTEMKRIHEDAGVEFIQLVGESLHMCSYYTASDCFIGTGRAALEAIACECPTIVAGVTGYLGILNKELHNKAWETWFCDHGQSTTWTIETFESDIKSVLGLSERERDDLGWVGRKFVEDKFNVHDTIPALFDIYLKHLKTFPFKS